MTSALLVACMALSQATAPESSAQSWQDDVRKSVIKFDCSIAARNSMQPWKRNTVQKIGGSGVVIAPGKILTNAHVVHNATEVLLETDQISLPLAGKVLAVDIGRDLALVSTDDPDFIEKHPPISILNGLPADGSRIIVMGYPMGGEALSTTEGVISRSEWATLGFNRAREPGMRVQVDAAINFGNSGGPAFSNGEIAGLVFSGLDKSQSDNISYLVSTEEINRFLAEVEAGTLDGNTMDFSGWQTLENPALRDKLGLDRETTGVVITKPSSEVLKPWDVLIEVNGYEIDNKGQITIEDDRKVALGCAFGRFDPLVDGPMVKAKVLRDGTAVDVDLPVETSRAGQLQHRVQSDYPYLVYGPIVFGPVHGDFITALGRNRTYIFYYGDSPVLPAMVDRSPATDDEPKEFVTILTPPMSHPMVRGYQVHPGQTVKSVNGQTFRDFEEFVTILQGLDEEFVVFEFNELPSNPLTFRRSEVADATDSVMESNGIRYRASKDIRNLLVTE